jgi:competence protein ComEA
MRVFFKTFFENISKITKYLSNYLTNDEQKIMYFLLFVLFLGTVLSFYGYSPQDIQSERYITANRDSLRAMISTDFVMRYDINKVTYDELLFINGIGPSTATAIINHQQSTGFSSIEDLLNIRGIGVVRLNNLRDYLFVVGEIQTQICDEYDEIEVNQHNTYNYTTTNPIETNDSNRSNALDSQLTSKININKATHEELMSLRGVGIVSANDIIAYRNLHGGFNKIEDLLNVRGIGYRTFENIKDLITIGE